jgi:hypothetical protein
MKLQGNYRTVSIMTTVFVLFMVLFAEGVFSQGKIPSGKTPKAELYYFHPTERCPIDQQIEELSRALISKEFSARIKDGSLKFMVINTEDKSQAKLVSRFDINAQALYLVTFPSGKEHKNDLTEFAFSNAQSNPGKFRSQLKQEILNALK